jgi:hypothetical protein
MHAPPQHFCPCWQPGVLSVQQAFSPMQVWPQHCFPAGQPASLPVQHPPAWHVVQIPRLQNPSQHGVVGEQSSPMGWQHVPPKQMVPWMS